jgi:hypothetical protein
MPHLAIIVAAVSRAAFMKPGAGRSRTSAFLARFYRPRTAAVLTLAVLAFMAVPPAAYAASVAAAGQNMSCATSGRPTDPAIASLLGLLGIVADPNTTVGVRCTPASAGDANFCAAENPFNGLVVFGRLGAC